MSLTPTFVLHAHYVIVFCAYVLHNGNKLTVINIDNTCVRNGEIRKTSEEQETQEAKENI